MNKQDAENLLYVMWENGELPSNFTEDHSDYYYAVQYTMKHEYFDYEDLY
jgi:hypothetical protein